ncbi:hypothetical protein [Leifsonia shinshuensis]|uniref:Uncharacterized protein n=1 Tax=Leifsonia shinshuensis TaxID=150026 RepID=A0A853CQ37_9MICO|nr:hypothetical protein [Leifsonia shinshuensis]NYJ23016.1 hypothetical protein [Leifsonia shinshuensis]
MTALHESSGSARLHRLHLRAVEPGRQATLRQIGRSRSRREQLERLHLFAAMRSRPPVFAYWSAALIHGLPLLNAPPPTIHVLAAGSTESAAHGVVSHRRSAAAPGVATHGLQVTPVAETVAALAGRTSFLEGVVLADHALHTGAFGDREALTCPAELIEAAGSLTDPSERRRSLAVAGFADGRSESPLESVSRATMALAGAPPPELQLRVHDLFGVVARLDFCWPGLGIAGEADGAEKLQHPASRRFPEVRQELAARVERDRRIERTGLRVVRWRWATGRRVDLMRELLLREGVPLDSRRRIAEIGLAP